MIKIYYKNLDALGRHVFIAGIIWLSFLLMLLIGGAEDLLSLAWGHYGLFAIGVYSISYRRLIPLAMERKRPFLNYMKQAFLVILLSMLPMWILMSFWIPDEDSTIPAVFLCSFLLFVFICPAIYYAVRKHFKGKEELYSLKRELGQSAAGFDFLRSQINPHFLFNALNTIYGTAIQEKADRTSESVQMLGEMMRFMLHENMKEKIQLVREIEYLENYIKLQKLRTDSSDQVQINTHIEQPLYDVEIAPMLLIPFVENAFKHGISFREPSNIRVTLEIQGSSLYFDVQNTKHPKPENDPEKNKSGIGLMNVKHRLQLLYPKRHELIIRETAKDFFVHLTIQLS